MEAGWWGRGWGRLCEQSHGLEREAGQGLAPAVTEGDGTLTEKQDYRPTICCRMKPSSCFLIKIMLAKVCSSSGAWRLRLHASPDLGSHDSIQGAASVALSTKHEAAGREGGLALPLLPCVPREILSLSLGLSCNRCLAKDFGCIMSCSVNGLSKPNVKVSAEKLLQTS